MTNTHVFRNPPGGCKVSRILGAFLVAGVLSSASAQITLRADELPLVIGHERDYLTHSADTVAIGSLIGAGGGPQVWDFTGGPADETYSYRNETPEGSPGADDFPDARIAERLTIDSTGQTSFSYFNTVGRGRELLGFYDGIGNPNYPRLVFDSPFRDLPTIYTQGSEWQDSTSFRTTQDVLGSPFELQVTLHLNSRVDAYGTAILPGLGEVEVLRVNELDRQETFLDTGNGLVPLDDIYIRVYLWVSREYGIVAQATSEASQGEPPPEAFQTSARFLRLSRFANPAPFEARITPFGDRMVRLDWDGVPGVDRFDIETTTTALDGGWQRLMTVDGLSADLAIDAPGRLFRVRPASAP